MKSRLTGDRAPNQAAIYVCLYAAVTLVACFVAYPRMFTDWMLYDDEGYLLMSLKYWLGHGSLYDQVYSQYGPFYYVAWGGLFSALGIPVTHDAGRFATIFAWVFPSLALGLVAHRLTRTVVLGVVVQMASFSALAVAVNEPMHPGGLICILLATIALISLRVRSSPAAGVMALLGAAVGALMLVKINVGIFALGALLLTVSGRYRVIRDRSWLRYAIVIGFVLTPVLLMAMQLEQDWVRDYAIHVAVAALALVLGSRASSTGALRPERELAWLAAGLVGAVAVVCAVTILTGTSPAGLYEGVIAQPIRSANLFSIPLHLWGGWIFVDLIALALAFACMHRAEVVRRLRIDDRTWVMAISLLSLCIGVGMVSPVAWGVLAPRPAFSLAAFSWLALTRLSQQNPDTETDFPRTLLPALAVLQVLHAYPVAGSQLGWSTVLLMVVGAMCIANGARGLLASIRVASPRGPSTLLGSVGAAALILFLGTDYLYRPWEQARSTYKELTPLMLHGASRIVVRPLRAERFREISAALKTRCTAVVMLPGMNSFYLWSNVEPPTGFNATAWMFMFSDELQQRIVDRVEHIDGLCLLRNRPQEALWARPRAFREGPLLRFMSRGFEQIDRFGPFELSRRNAPKS